MVPLLVQQLVISRQHVQLRRWTPARMTGRTPTFLPLAREHGIRVWASIIGPSSKRAIGFSLTDGTMTLGGGVREVERAGNQICAWSMD